MRFVALCRLVWRKLVVDRMRYATRGGYRAAEYWRDRLDRAGNSLIGPGHEGWSEARNQEMYDEARRVLESELDRVGGGRAGDSVLEIGPGTGYWTNVCHERGIETLTALDITDSRFPDLRHRFPGYRFLVGDATKGVPEGRFQLVLIMDVIEHVVSLSSLQDMLRYVESATVPGGLLAISFPPPSDGRRDLYYLKFWPVDTVLAMLPGCTLVSSVGFRDGILLLLRRNGGHEEGRVE